MGRMSRRAMIGVCGATVAIEAGCLGRTDESNDSEPSGGSWTSFRGGPTNAAFVDGSDPGDEPTDRWSVDCASTPGTAAIADGTAYLAAGSTLRAVGLADGEERWTADLERGRTGAPAVADDAVICPVDGALIVVDREGANRRRIPLDGGDASARLMSRQQAQPLIRSSPNVVDGTAYVGTQGGDLVAVALADGEVMWRSPATAEMTTLSQERQFDAIVSTPAIADGRVIVGTESGIAAFDRTDGSSAWTHETDRAMGSSPAVVDGTVYDVGSVPIALAADSGDVQWRAEDAFAALSERRTVRWNGALALQEWVAIGSSVAVADEVVVVHDSDERLIALDRDDGDRRWEVPFDGVESLSTTASSPRFRAESTTTQTASSWSSPAIAGDTVVVGTSRGIVAASLADGDGLWRFPTDSRVVASPAVADGTVVVGDESGSVYALGME